MKKLCCIICGKPLNNGIMIYGRGMCSTCQERLVNIEISTDFYKHYKNCIKKNLVHSIIRGEEKECQTYR